MSYLDPNEFLIKRGRLREKVSSLSVCKGLENKFLIGINIIFQFRMIF